MTKYDEELSMRIAREIFTQEELEEILLFEEENEIDLDDLLDGWDTCEEENCDKCHCSECD
jgi:hypothetical protein